MSGIVAVNAKKIKASASVNRLLDENYRTAETAEKYEDGHRIIRTADTGKNVFLLQRPENYDQVRRERVKAVNDAVDLRRSAKVGDDKRRYQKLRHDAVDTLGLVVQPSADWINSLPREQQIQFFRDALDVMIAKPDYFGRIDTAVVHVDENTPHMQCLASTINQQTMKSDAKKILGNKSRMSQRQTVLAEGLKAKGWDVERGVKRIDNPAYQNWRDDKEREGLKVNRHNDMILLQRDLDLTAREQAVTSERAALAAEKNEWALSAGERRKWQASAAERAEWADKMAKLEALKESVNTAQKALNASRSDFEDEKAEWDANAPKRAVSAAERVKMDAREAAVREREDSLAEKVKNYNKIVRKWNNGKDARDKERAEWDKSKPERDAWAAGAGERKAWADGQGDRDMWADRMAELKRQQDILQKQQAAAYEAIQQASAGLSGLTDAELARRAQAAREVAEMSNTLDFPARAAQKIREATAAAEGGRPGGRPSGGTPETYSDDDLLDFANAVAGIRQDEGNLSR